MKRQQKELLESYEKLIEELASKKLATGSDEYVAHRFVSAAQDILVREFSRGSAESAAFVLDKYCVETKDYDSPIFKKIALLARRTETIGYSLNN